MFFYKIKRKKGDMGMIAYLDTFVEKLDNFFFSGMQLAFTFGMLLGAFINLLFLK